MNVPRSSVPDTPAEGPESLAGLAFSAWCDLVQLTPFGALLDSQKKGGMIRHWTVLWQDQWRRQLWWCGLHP
ncbi:MAG: hypothetical protein ACEQSB_05170 [Undibacterium sp.]